MAALKAGSLERSASSNLVLLPELHFVLLYFAFTEPQHISLYLCILSFFTCSITDIGRQNLQCAAAHGL